MRYVFVTVCLVIGGCATFTSTYSYRALNEDCNCEEYQTQDKDRKITYHFRAHYNMHGGVNTTIEIEITNNGDDTLFLDAGSAKISSRNISYQYNNKLVPLPHLFIEPSHSDVVRMVGSDISGTDDWNKIAGEQLTLTLQGMRSGNRPVAAQHVTFVPTNPRLHQ